MILPGSRSIGREQRRGFSSPVCCITGFSEVVQHITILLSQCSDDGHNAFDEATSCLALSAKAAVAPQHTGTNLPLAKVIGRFRTFDAHEGPQGIFTFEDIAAGSGRLGVIASGPVAEQLPDLVLDGLHLFLKGGPTHCAIPHPVPPLKHQLSLGQEGFTDSLRFVAPFHECLEVTKEVCPA